MNQADTGHLTSPCRRFQCALPNTPYTDFPLLVSHLPSGIVTLSPIQSVSCLLTHQLAGMAEQVQPCLSAHR